MSAVVHDLNEARVAQAYALRYALLGWHVLPLNPGTKKPLGRLVRNGFHDATTDADQIRAWWTSEPTANVGIALKASGLVAVDIDPRNGGLETMERLEALHGPVTSDVLAYTGGGGEHRVFAAALVEHLPGKLGPGVDLKADGYIAVEPTFAPLAEPPHSKPYMWEASSDPLDGVVPSTLPAWIRDMSRTAPSLPAVTAPVHPINPQRRADAEHALQHINADDRDTWVQVGQAISNEMPGADGFALWDAWSQQSSKYDAQDQLRVWRSFKPRGLAGVGLNTVFKMAQDSGWKNAGPAALAGEVSSHSTGLPLVFSEEITQAAIHIDQLVEDVITRGGLSVMYGESNSGKSFMACDMSCHIGTGRDWLGKRTVLGAVLYVAGEGAESIKLRVLAWRQLHEATPALAIVPVAVNLLDARADLSRLTDACTSVSARYSMPVSLIVIDTLARAFGGGNENASEDMGAVITHADKLREQTGAHVMFVHHAGKDAAKGSRGHSSLKAATDTEIEVSGEESTKLHTARITKQRDLGSRGDEITATFRVVEMGRGQWDKPITTCVVEATDRRAAVAAIPSKKAKGTALQTALITTLAQATNRTMRRAELVKALTDQGFTTSPIYRAVAELAQQNVITETMGRVHLNGQGPAKQE
jgi:hypothetical protein